MFNACRVFSIDWSACFFAGAAALVHCSSALPIACAYASVLITCDSAFDHASID
jgi:hypothetical protein